MPQSALTEVTIDAITPFGIGSVTDKITKEHGTAPKCQYNFVCLAVLEVIRYW